MPNIAGRDCIRRNLALALVALFFSLMFSATTMARTYGLLVGVSDYPNLARRFQLKGPGNDVELMRKVLEQRGVAAGDIVLLRSGGQLRPTRSNIISALRQLAKKVKKGDFVYLHFAGHGSQQPAQPGDLDEGDGLDEIFLPEDVGKWQDSIGAVKNAITDNELNRLITAIRNRGAFIWAVFDSCHSGTMLRSVSRIKWRKVSANALGIPRERRKGRSKKGSQPHFGQPSPLGSLAAMADVSGPSKTDVEGRGGYVAFYAAQTNELAPELSLPPGLTPKRSHGMFSYALAEAITAAPDVSYRRLGQMILQKYVRQGMRATTPLIEGSHLDAPLFGQQNRPLQRQWPVALRGARKKRLYVPAGRLHKIGKGAVFAILKNAADRDEAAIGYARADLVELFGAQLSPIEYAGKKPLKLSSSLRSAYARVIKPAFAFSLKVALPEKTNAVTSRERRMLGAVKAFADRGGDKGGAKPGLQIEWVKAGQPADVRLAFTPARKTAQDAPAQPCPRNHLWFLDRSGALLCHGARKNMSFEIGQPSAAFDRNVAAGLK